MAYDPNDADDKKVVGKLIKEAVEAALSEATSEHEADIEGLKTKNRELLAKIKKGESDPEEVSRLETQLEKNQADLKQAQKDLKVANKQSEELTTKLQTETKFGEDLLLDGGLTAELVSAKIAPDFIPAVKALLKPQLKIKIEGDNRTVLFGDKPLKDGVTEWSQGDQGKIYIAAAINGGGGAAGGSRGNGQNGKSMTRAAYEAMVTEGVSPSKFFAEGGVLTD